MFSHGLPVDWYDANVEFFTGYLLKPETLRGFIAAIKNRTAQGAYKAADPGTLSVLKDLEKNPLRWDQWIAAVGQYLASCRAENFYMSEHGVDALDKLNALLQLVSLAFYPSIIRWGDFFNPAASNCERIHSFVNDAHINPFLAFSNAWLAPKLRQPGLQRLLLRVCSADQLPALATMSVISKNVKPDLRVTAVGAPGLLAGCKLFADDTLAITAMQSFAELVKRLCGHDFDKAASGPGAGSFTSRQYLAPAIVVPVDLTTGEGLQADSASGFYATVTACRDTFGAQGLLIKGAKWPAGLFTRTAPPGGDKEQAVSLGIRIKLRESCREIDGEALCRAGVKLIAWRSPSGSLAVLQDVLWKVSRAGIWNNLKIPANAGDDLVKALTHFAALNPNIVHSCSHDRGRGLPAGDSEEQALWPPAYNRVRKLPGRPLWQSFTDPAHLLLYLDRHGIQKVMRWRMMEGHPGGYTLGSHLEYHYVKPEDLPRGYLEEICLMVEAGGSVNMERVRYNLQRAFLIAYVLEKGVIVGNYALKYPRAEYIKAVNRQSGLDLSQFLERGYASVRPEYRGLGIGARLLAGLTERAGSRKVFSVIGEDNLGAQKMAARKRTRRVAAYYSERVGKRVGVWIPERMID